MAPTHIPHAANRYPRLTYSLLSLATHQLGKLSGYSRQDVSQHLHTYVKRSEDRVEQIVFAVLIPVLVLLSGLFAGLTLGYMSLDETQLHVLSISGTPYVSSLHFASIMAYRNIHPGNRRNTPTRSCQFGRMATSCS